MSDHTPGPWIDALGTSTGRVVIAPGQPKVRYSVAACGGPKRDANARLIAAAPDLLLQLTELLADIGPANADGWHDSTIHSQWVEQARAAVAKATLAPGDADLVERSEGI